MEGIAETGRFLTTKTKNTLNVLILTAKCSNLDHEMFKSQPRNVQITAAKCSNLGCEMFKSRCKYTRYEREEQAFPDFFLQRHETDGVANGGRAACISETTVQHIICER